MSPSTSPDQVSHQPMGTVVPPGLGGVSVSAPRAKRPRGPEHVWQAHKATIKTLYIDQDQSLKDVMEYMKQNYGFEASIKSYRVRLNRWGFSKYITGKLEQEALRVADDLHRQGGPVPETFQLDNGAVVSLGDLALHLRRKRYIAKSSYSPASSALRPPDDLWLSEGMLSSAREYIRRQQPTVGRGADQDLDLRHSLTSPLGDFFKGSVALRRFIKESKFEHALPMLRNAPLQMQMLLGQGGNNAVDNPAGCVYITVLCIKWHDSMSGHVNDILRALIKYAASVMREGSSGSGTGSGPVLPLRQILAGLSRIDDAIFREAVVQTWKCHLQTWTEMVAPEWDIQLLGEWMALAEMAGVHHLPGDLVQGLEDAIRRHEVQYGPCSLPVLTLLWLQAEYERLCAETYHTSTENAVRVFVDLLERGKDFDKLSRYSTQFFLAKEFRKSGDLQNAERYLHDAIEGVSGLKDKPCYAIWAVQELTLELEQWPTQWGKDDKAMDIRHRLLDMCLAHERGLSEPGLTVEPKE